MSGPERSFSMRRGGRLPNQPRTSGHMRRRLVCHHLPLSFASAVALFLFMTLPSFDANRYAHADLSSGVFPKQRERAAGAAMAQGAGHAGHRGARARAGSHGGGHSGTRGHSAGQAGSTGHVGEAGSMSHGRGGMSRSGRTANDSFLRLDTRRFTVATAYVATGLLVLTLLIGPANLLLRRRNPVSSYLRRDVGTWTALFSVIHVFYGLQVHRRLADFLD